MVTSAGLLLHRGRGAALEVWIAHMGGPFWRGRDRAWTIPKGEFEDASEPALDAARREFAEEHGVPAPPGDAELLGRFRQRAGKVVTVFALAAASFELDSPRGETLELEWPPRSGRTIVVPEIDEARWVRLREARELVVQGQIAALDELAARVAAR
jgi:predicted NUDIX family NTP pyrophosphohydrolase